MSIIKSIYKIFNGESWDEHYLKTSSDQVAHTKSDGTATTVQSELLDLDSKTGNGHTLLWSGSAGNGMDITLNDDYMNYDMLILCFKSSGKIYSVIAPTDLIAETSSTLTVQYPVGADLDTTFYQWGNKNLTMWMSTTLTLYKVYGA